MIGFDIINMKINYKSLVIYKQFVFLKQIFVFLTKRLVEKNQSFKNIL